MPMQSMPPPVFADSEPDGAGAAGAPPPPGGGAGAGSIDPAGWIDWMAAHPVQSMPPPPSATMSALVSALMPASAAVSALVSRAIAGAKAAIAAESAAAGPSGSPLAPPEGTYVLADQPPKPGLCFKVTPKVYAVAFEDGSWSGFEIDHARTASRSMWPMWLCRMAAAGRWSRHTSMGRAQSVDGLSSTSTGTPPPLSPAATSPFTTPRLPPLKTGDRVNCTGKVWSGKGHNAASGEGVTFIAIAQQKVKVSPASRATASCTPHTHHH